jgi:pilus assembly protein CpaE
MQRIAIVDPSEVTREPLRNLLLGVESVWIEAECARYEFFLDVVQQSQPDVVVVSLDADQAKALQLITQVAAEYSSLPVLAISGRGDGQSILQALRAGAKEFLTQPVVLEDLLKALHRLADNGPAAAGAPRASSLVVAVAGSRGGVGCTSLAVNLGSTLAQQEHNSVALIDLDLALGDADVALDLLPDHTLADVAQNIERLDMQFLRRTLCKHDCGLALLPHPVRIEELSMIHEEHLQRAITLLRASYTHLILDLSKGFTVTDLTALHMANEILLVAQLELSSLRNAVRVLMTMGTEEGLTEKIKIVVNRVGADFVEGDISIKKAEEILGKPIFWQVPNDSKAMIGSRTAGVPLVQHSPKSRVQQSIAGLATALCGTNGKVDTKAKAAAGGGGLWPWRKS